MNKLLLAALLGFALVAFTAGEEEFNEKNLEASQVDINALREVREAEPKNNDNKSAKKGKKSAKKGKKGKKAAKKDKKGKKAKKGKKGKKSAKKGKKGRKGKKGKKSSKKGKKGNKGKKGKKGKKAGKKSKKDKKAKKAKKAKNAKKGKKGKKSGKATTCTEDNSSCLTNLVKYHNIMKERVANFGRQKSRITKFNKLAGNKGGKKGEFKDYQAKLRQAGGGNSSNLTCQGSSSNKGAELMKSTYTSLGECEDKIKAKCMTAAPAIDTTALTACETKMTNFGSSFKKCADSTDSERCTCWNSTDLSSQLADLKACDISSNNTKVTTFQKGCTKAFSACRTLEDSVSQILFICSETHSTAKLLVKVKSATANKASLEKLKTSATSKASRVARAASCSDFTKSITKVSIKIQKAPSKNMTTTIDAITSDAPSSCTTTEKTALKTVISGDLADAISECTDYITAIQADIKAVSGSTASSAQIAAATSAATTTTASSSGRRNFRLFMNQLNNN